VLRLLGAQNVWPVVFGLGTGVGLGILLGRIVGSQVMLVQDPLDLGGFAMGLGAFVVIALMATLSPAVRALRIDPSSTLRCE
jgi:ABC-type lipoprotein release transport system permease subunit